MTSVEAIQKEIKELRKVRSQSRFHVSMMLYIILFKIDIVKNVAYSDKSNDLSRMINFLLMYYEC